MRLTQTQPAASHGYGTSQEAPPPYQEALSMPPPYMPNTYPKPNASDSNNIYPSVPYPAGPTPHAYISAPPPLRNNISL